MDQVEGKFGRIIYKNETNYYGVVLFRVKNSNVEELNNSTIRVVGTLTDMDPNYFYDLKGKYEFNKKYKSNQFTLVEASKIMPSKKDELLAFLTSPAVKGCGKKTAESLYNLFGEKTLDKITDIQNIYKVSGMAEARALKIHASALKIETEKENLEELKKIGFSNENITKIISRFKTIPIDEIKSDIYILKDIISFDLLDSLFLKHNHPLSEIRLFHLFIEAMNYISNGEGDVYYHSEKIIATLKNVYNVLVDEEVFLKVINSLKHESLVTVVEDKYYLSEYFTSEKQTASILEKINSRNKSKVTNIDKHIKTLEEEFKIKYDDVQKKAIKSALENSITIISGGPGTGKTTILKAVVNIYLKISKLDEKEIALLAPTGRASKKIKELTGFPSYTIHKFLGWNKDDNSFEYNINRKHLTKFVVVDEASMVDAKLFHALLSALLNDVKLILVGDAFQLPSVGAGNILNDLISCNYFNFISLSKIYRQSEESFIPYLASDIKEKNIEEHMLLKRSDYNFLSVASENIITILKEIIIKSKDKNITEDNLQVLIPVYKGRNGIDNINLILRDIYNKKEKKKKEITFNNVLFREGDKLLQTKNDPDLNIFNGDIGFIKHIYKDEIEIAFDNEIVLIKKSKLLDLKHAYAISVHKSQGSEFDHVVIPIVRDYSYMFYNKLIYTAVSRAKKSLILLGSKEIFKNAILNDYSTNRLTTLKERLKEVFE